MMAGEQDQKLAETMAIFFRQAVAAGVVWAVRGREGLARVDSQIQPNRYVTLLWSQREEAERWASVLATEPNVMALTLRDLLVDLLPMLARSGGHVGTDWNSEPIEPELDPADLAGRLRAEAVANFIDSAVHSRIVWVLHSAQGPACLMSKTRPGQMFLPCWADRASAEALIAGALTDVLPGSIPLANFLGRTLMWLTEVRCRVSPAYIEGEGGIELEPYDLKGRMKRAIEKARPAA
jgi:hypothetical protein